MLLRGLEEDYRGGLPWRIVVALTAVRRSTLIDDCHGEQGEVVDQLEVSKGGTNDE
jgi:hypothetical protein